MHFFSGNFRVIYDDLCVHLLLCFGVLFLIMGFEHDVFVRLRHDNGEFVGITMYQGND